MEIVDPKFLWSDFYIFNITNKAIVDHLNFIKNIINKFKIRERDLIIDIEAMTELFLTFLRKKTVKF